MKNERTEIILFMPISQMQRFTAKALGSDEKHYKALRKLISELFNQDHPIRNQVVKPIKYISYIKEALRFESYYSTSYFLDRGKGIYYALFFISPHIYGFLKTLEVKWELDKRDGGGFTQPPNNPSLLEAQMNELIRRENYLESTQKVLSC